MILDFVHDGLVLEDGAVGGEINGLGLFGKDLKLSARIVIAFLEGYEGGGCRAFETEGGGELGPVDFEGGGTLGESIRTWGRDSVGHILLQPFRWVERVKWALERVEMLVLRGIESRGWMLRAWRSYVGAAVGQSHVILSLFL